MSDNNYECLFILDANAYARDPGGAATSIAEMIQNAGGNVLASRLWNEQKLAYPIRGRHKGAYWLTYFTMEGENLTGFNRACQLNDIVMRHLIIKIDPRLIESFVAAAKGENVAQPEGEEESKATDSEQTEAAPTETETADAT